MDGYNVENLFFSRFYCFYLIHTFLRQSLSDFIKMKQSIRAAMSVLYPNGSRDYLSKTVSDISILLKNISLVRIESIKIYAIFRKHFVMTFWSNDVKV